MSSSYAFNLTVFDMIAEMRINNLRYKTIYMDGRLGGVRNLQIGQGVNFLLGEKVCSNCYSRFML